MTYVYILQSEKDDTLKAPFKLVWYSAFLDQKKAQEFEKYLKSSSSFAFRNKHLV